jgi:ubiquinone/menaquinone biosynthesis C-methylase UbiE
VIDDCTQEWLFGEDSLDYVHVRYMTGSIPDWRTLFSEAFRCCKSGGYLESLEAEPYMQSNDGTVRPGSAMAQWGPMFVGASGMLGASFTMVNDDEQRLAMEAAGFVDIQEYNVRVSAIDMYPQ